MEVIEFINEDIIEFKTCPTCQAVEKSLLLAYTACGNRAMWTCLQCGVVFTTNIVTQKIVTTPRDVFVSSEVPVAV